MFETIIMISLLSFSSFSKEWNKRLLKMELRTVSAHIYDVHWRDSKPLVWSEFNFVLIVFFFVNEHFIHQKFITIHTFPKCEWKIHIKANFYQWLFHNENFFWRKNIHWFDIHVFIKLIIGTISRLNEFRKLMIET